MRTIFHQIVHQRIEISMVNKNRTVISYMAIFTQMLGLPG